MSIDRNKAFWSNFRLTRSRLGGKSKSERLDVYRSIRLGPLGLALVNAAKAVDNTNHISGVIGISTLKQAEAIRDADYLVQRGIKKPTNI